MQHFGKTEECLNILLDRFEAAARDVFLSLVSSTWQDLPLKGNKEM